MRHDTHNLNWRGPELYWGASHTGFLIVPDTKYPSMWRVRHPDGQLSDMVSRVRAKDAAVHLCQGTGESAQEAPYSAPIHSPDPPLSQPKISPLTQGPCDMDALALAQLDAGDPAVQSKYARLVAAADASLHGSPNEVALQSFQAGWVASPVTVTAAAVAEAEAVAIDAGVPDAVA
jgi:hypothetical protein